VPFDELPSSLVEQIAWSVNMKFPSSK